MKAKKKKINNATVEEVEDAWFLGLSYNNIMLKVSMCDEYEFWWFNKCLSGNFSVKWHEKLDMPYIHIFPRIKHRIL